MDDLHKKQMLLMYGEVIPNGSLKMVKVHQNSLGFIKPGLTPSLLPSGLDITQNMLPSISSTKGYVIKWIDMNLMTMSLRMVERDQEKANMIGKLITLEQKHYLTPWYILISSS
jgi:hypothetical protein